MSSMEMRSKNVLKGCVGFSFPMLILIAISQSEAVLTMMWFSVSSMRDLALAVREVSVVFKEENEGLCVQKVGHNSVHVFF